MNEDDKPVTFEEMKQMVIQRIIMAFGKGESLDNAAHMIVASCAQWGADNIKRARRKSHAL